MEFSKHSRACVIMNLLFFCSTPVRKPITFKDVALCISVFLHLLQGGGPPGSSEDAEWSRITSVVVLEMHQDTSAKSANNFCTCNNCSTLNFAAEVCDHARIHRTVSPVKMDKIDVSLKLPHGNSVSTTVVSPIVNFLSCSDLTVTFSSTPKCKAGEDES